MELELDGLSWWGIDPHEHDRGEEQSDKATIASTLILAHEQGIGTIFGMPNTARPVINRYRVWERLALVPEGERKNYRLYVGLTGDESQIIEALWCYDNIPEVIGLKMFVGKSVGDLSVIDIAKQRMVYRILAKHGFKGVLALHCEKEESMDSRIWDPDNPITHGWARPEIAENVSTGDQIEYALLEGFVGRLHICHVSSPMSVYIIETGRKMGLTISCGLTPQHAKWDERIMRRPDGLLYKVNPPLRPMQSVLEMRRMLVEGRINLIETDHAPHTAVEKGRPLCLSGIPSMTEYRKFVMEFLPSLGLTASAIKALTRDNVIEIFGDKLR